MKITVGKRDPSIKRYINVLSHKVVISFVVVITVDFCFCLFPNTRGRVLVWTRYLNQVPTGIFSRNYIQSPYVEGINTCPFLTYPRFTLF